MTDLEDLFDGQMTLDAVNLCNDGSSSLNLMPKDDDVAVSQQKVDLRAMKMTKKLVQFGYMKMDPENVDMSIIDELGQPNQTADNDEQGRPYGSKTRKMLSEINSGEATKQPINLMSRRIYLNESVDITASQIEADKNDVIDLFLEPYKTHEKMTPTDRVGMGVHSSENMKEFAKFRQTT